MPLFDGYHFLSLNSHLDDRLEYAKRVLDSVDAGLFYFIIHPCTDTPEIRSLAPDWQARVADYQLFISDEWRKVIEATGVKIVGMKQLQNAMLS